MKTAQTVVRSFVVAAAAALTLAALPCTASALILPGIGEIPGTEGIPLDASSASHGFGGFDSVADAESFAEQEIWDFLQEIPGL